MPVLKYVDRAFESALISPTLAPNNQAVKQFMIFVMG